MKSRPVIIIFSILAALQVLSGGAAFADIVGKDVFAMFVLGVAAVQVGMTFFVQNSVVPAQDSVSYINTEGVAVAGPAAGLTNGTPVVVQQAPVDTSGPSKRRPLAP